MITPKFIFALLAGILALIGNIPYLVRMFRGHVRPHPYTWFIWSIVSGVTFFGQWAGGAGWALIAFGASEIFTIIIFLFSLRYGFKHIPKHDTVYLIVALLGILPWIISRDPTWSVVIMVSLDVIAFIPTLIKTSRHPQSETPVLYGANTLRHTLALVALGNYNIATMLHSITMILTNTGMVILIALKPKKSGR